MYLESPALLVILDEVALIKVGSCCVDEVGPPLLQEGVCLQLVH